MKVSSVGCLALAASGLFGGTLASAGVLWDTGAPHQVNFNGAESYLGFSSGNVGQGLEQRWAAIPFKVSSNGTVINAVDLDWFNPGGGDADTVNYTIWKRTGLNAPVDGDQYSTGILGVYADGTDDPRTATGDNWLHQYTGLNIPIDAGDYYFTMFAEGGVAPNNAAWVTGGDLQDESLEQDFMWRSAQFPSPGFQMYNPNNLLPGANMADGQDRFNPSFVLYGDVVPAPGAAALLGLGGLMTRRRR